MKKDPQNCPLCETEEKKVLGGWALSRGDWKNIREKHEREHRLVIDE
jgi:hypothetical protein